MSTSPADGTLPHAELHVSPAPPTTRRKIIACCDGTWNSEKFATPLTNVSRISRCILPYDQDGVPQIVYYQDGVGTGTSKASKPANVFEGMTGAGTVSINLWYVRIQRSPRTKASMRTYVPLTASFATITPASTTRYFLLASRGAHSRCDVSQSLSMR